MTFMWLISARSLATCPRFGREACAKDACLYQDRAAAVLFKMSCGELSPFLRKTLAATAGDFN